MDTNTVLSALIGGASRSLIVKLDRELCYPAPSFAEVDRNRGVIQERAGLSASKVDALVDTIFEYVRLVPEADVLQHLDTAATATSPHPDADRKRSFSDRDEDDVIFLATALAEDGAIWSDDDVFQHQAHVPWFRTSDVVEHTEVDL